MCRVKVPEHDRLPKQLTTLIDQEDKAGEVEDRVTARLARKILFSRERPARFTFFIHEFVLRTPVGGPAAMSDQLHHLLEMSVRSCLTLRVVPASLGAHAAMTGAFTFMEIATYRSILAALAATALGEEESRELIATLATELYEDHDERA